MMQFLLNLIFFASLISGSVSIETEVTDASQDQYDFLTELYTSTSGEMWVNNTNWLVKNDNITLCNWYGITCSGKWVQKINLNKNGLGGPLPDRWERVPYLESVDLSANKILGSLPPSIGNLTLTNLLLNGNSLRGKIPDTLGKLGARLLYLADNQFTGTVPASLGKNPLVGLTLDLNKLTGTFPSQIADIGSQFMVISASFNDFTGVLPSGVCQANSCSFQYNAHLGCPSGGCNNNKCMLSLCNCGKVCSTSTDCAGGSCSGCSTGPWGYKTCGGK